MKEEQYLIALKTSITAKMGRSMTQPSDFELLIDEIARQNDEKIGMSTVKRLFDYIDNDHAFTARTLSVLARFLGCNDWADFCFRTEMQAQSDSGFLYGKQIRSSQLKAGDIVEATWMPDRRCQFRYEGDNTYDVVLAENAKLQVGNTCQALLFAKGQPLYIANLQYGDGKSYTYVAGKTYGLTNVELVGQ